MTANLWDDSRSRNTNRAIYASATLAAVAIGLHLSIPFIDVPGSVISHIGGEVLASVLAAIVGTTLITISRSTGLRWLKILGAGFVTVAVLDLLHASLSSVAAAESVGNGEQLISWSSLASRVVLAVASLCAALALGRKEPEADSGLKTRVVPSAIVVGVIVSSALIATFVASDSPAFSLPVILSFVPGTLFIVAFFVVQGRTSQFNHMLSVFTVFLIAGGISDAAFMPYLGTQHDEYFGTAHLFKFFSYVLVLIGIVAESLRLYSFESLARQELGRINETLNESNLHLTSAKNDLLALNKIGRIAGASHSVAENFAEVAEIIIGRVHADRIFIATISTAETEYRINAVYGVTMPGRSQGDSIRTNGTYFGELIERRRTLVFGLPEVAGLAVRDPRLEDDIAAGFRSWISTPVVSENEMVGVLMARSRQPNAYGARESQFLEQVASQLAGLLRQGREFSSEAA